MRILIALILAASIVTGVNVVIWDHPTVRAQDAPPEPGDVILADALTGPTVVNPYPCPSGRMTREFANDGLTITASGGCQSPEQFPGSGIDLGNRLTFADGEVRVDVRQISGADRTQIRIFLRSKNEGGFSAYSAQLSPARGMLQVGVSVNNQYKQLGQRADLASIVKSDDWNTLAFSTTTTNVLLSSW